MNTAVGAWGDWLTLAHGQKKETPQQGGLLRGLQDGDLPWALQSAKSLFFLASRSLWVSMLSHGPYDIP